MCVNIDINNRLYKKPYNERNEWFSKENESEGNVVIGFTVKRQFRFNKNWGKNTAVNSKLNGPTQVLCSVPVLWACVVCVSVSAMYSKLLNISWTYILYMISIYISIHKS